MTIILSDAQIVVNGVVFLTLLFAIITTTARYRTLRRNLEERLRTPMIGAAGWDISKSWASTFTAFFALLGTFLSMNIPNSTEPLSSTQFAFLNFMFGAIVIIAPLLYNATAKQIKVNGQTFIQGYVGTFLLATTLTMWAVIGELWSIFFIVVSMDPAISTLGVKIIFTLLLLIAWVLMLWRAWFMIEETISAQTQSPFMPGMAPMPPGAPADAAPEPARQPAPSWSLL